MSLLVAPPLYLQPAGAAIGELAERMARFATGLGAAITEPWSRQAADHWMGQARGVADEVRRAEVTVQRAEEAARLNPRGRRGRDAHPRFRATLTALERCHLTLRTLARAVLDRTYFVPQGEQSAAYTPEQRAALADLLATAGAAIGAVAPIAAGGEAAESARLRVEEHLSPSTSAAPASPACSPSTRWWTRPRGRSTARCSPPSTGCAWRSPPRPARSSRPGSPRRRSRARCAGGWTRWRPRRPASPTDGAAAADPAHVAPGLPRQPWGDLVRQPRGSPSASSHGCSSGPTATLARISTYAGPGRR